MTERVRRSEEDCIWFKNNFAVVRNDLDEYTHEAAKVFPGTMCHIYDNKWGNRV